jgi:hypothetical protein
MRTRHSLTSALVLAAAGCFVAGSVSAADPSAPPKRLLSKEFQNNTSLGGTGEISTTAAALAAGAGGTVIYDKTLLEIPNDIDVLDIEFEGQGDQHNGSALLMNASVNGVLCQPLLGQTAGGGGGPHVQTGWYTLSHLPQSTTGTNCNDGGGGTADCHDNTIVFSCCARIESEDARVQIKLANLPGGGANFSFIERTLIVIEGTKDNAKHTLCTGVSTAAHTEDLGSP